jgi:uncharacterized protein
MESEMPYIIDGHNLIPKIKGLSLKAMDDEMQLVELLQIFSRVRRQGTEVYFDGAPAGQAGIRRMGTVTAHFVKKGLTADEAIISRLNKMGRSAKNWIVVSSDHRVQVESRAKGAEVMLSEEFARQLEAAFKKGEKGEKNELALSEDEIADWLRLFGGKSK